MKYQTRIRKSPDTVWPLRRSSGETWAQRPPVVKPDQREGVNNRLDSMANRY